MTVIRKHAAPAALGAMLLAALAAPYLIPAEPNSAIFRNGTLGLLLVAAAAWPAYEAFSRADRRTLACGLGWVCSFRLPWGWAPSWRTTTVCSREWAAWCAASPCPSWPRR